MDACLPKEKLRDIGLHLLTQPRIFWGYKKQLKVVELLKKNGLLDLKGFEQKILLACNRRYWSVAFKLIDRFSTVIREKTYLEIIENKSLGFEQNMILKSICKIGYYKNNVLL